MEKCEVECSAADTEEKMRACQECSNSKCFEEVEACGLNGGGETTEEITYPEDDISTPDDDTQV